MEWFVGQKELPIFVNCMIETLNRCNGTCEFCPANKNDEDRPLKKMTDEMFQGIIGQLRDMNWKGKLFLSINNEPFIDRRLLDFARYAKSRLPDSPIAAISNGTLLSVQKMDEMAEVIDELVLNDYSEKYVLSEPHRSIYRHIKAHKERFSKMNVIINRRYSKEILATRAGNAPNKPKKNNRIDAPCIYPFTDFLIFPDGMVGMCCNDCKEVSNFGDVKSNSIPEIWRNEKFHALRSAMLHGRSTYPFCVECDVVDAGGREQQIRQILQKTKGNNN